MIQCITVIFVIVCQWYWDGVRSNSRCCCAAGDGGDAFRWTGAGYCRVLHWARHRQGDIKDCRKVTLHMKGEKNDNEGAVLSACLSVHHIRISEFWTWRISDYEHTLVYKTRLQCHSDGKCNGKNLWNTTLKGITWYCNTTVTHDTNKQTTQLFLPKTFCFFRLIYLLPFQ